MVLFFMPLFSYFVSLKFVTFNYSEDILDESERYLMERKKIGIPSLKIVFKFREMVNNKINYDA